MFPNAQDGKFPRNFLFLVNAIRERKPLACKHGSQSFAGAGLQDGAGGPVQADCTNIIQYEHNIMLLRALDSVLNVIFNVKTQNKIYNFFDVTHILTRSGPVDRIQRTE